MKRLLRKILLVLRPLDARLRRVKGYGRLTAGLRHRYRAAMGFGAASAPHKPLLQKPLWPEGLETVPLRQDTILFECYWGKKFGDHPLALYRALRHSQPPGRFRIYWAIAGNATPPAEIAENPDVTLVRLRSAEYGRALLEAAQSILPGTVTDVLITDITRQDA